MAAVLPAFHRFEEQPPLAAYHPTVVDATRCVSRRTDEDHMDRRWTPIVYGSYQCKSLPVVGSDLCEVCRRREAKNAEIDDTTRSGWNGRMTDAELPADSHIAGSEWFHTKAKWTGVAKPKTRRMEERSDERRLIADKELKRFTDGKVLMEIERLSADNQITAQQLRDMVCRLTEKPIGADRINGYDKKEKLCELIRKLMDPAGEAPKFTVHYPKAEGGAGSPAASVSAGTASVSSAEDDATAAELVAKDAEIAELRAQIAALQGKLTKMVLILADD
jgi:hypothetical protein